MVRNGCFKKIYICYVYNIIFPLFGDIIQGVGVSEMVNWVYIRTDYVHNINFFHFFLFLLMCFRMM